MKELTAAEKILVAIDVAYRTNKNAIEVPESLITDTLRTALNLDKKKGRIAQFKVVVVPDIRSYNDEHHKAI